VEITLNKKDETFGSLKVQLVESDYQEGVKKRAKEFGKKAQVKGFRPGKIPHGVIMQMAGDNLIAEEVYSLLSESIKQYLSDNKLKTIGEPIPSEEDNKRVIDWKKDKSFDFNYDLGLIPDFKAELSSKDKFDYYKIKVDKKVLDEANKNLQKQHAKQNEVDSVEVNDFVYGEIKPEGQEAEGKETLLLTERLTKKGAKLFEGKSAGDIVTFDPKAIFEEEKYVGYFLDVPEEEVNAVSGEYEYKITKITRQEAPELNQDFFDITLGKDQATNEKEYLVKLEELVGANYIKDTDAKLYFDIQEKIVEKSGLKISEKFAKRWLLATNKELTTEKIEADLGKYIREIKWSIIKNQLAIDNDIKVEDQAIKNKAGEMLQAQYFGGQAVPEEMIPMFENFVDNYLKEGEGRNYYGIVEQVLADELFVDFKSKVTLKEKSVSIEEFQKIIEKG